ncbi:hypothetical protein AF2641_09735 [Anoxybacillus flavithermus]|nr:hypothetical protein AF2641_09735 [Anoxybacillus flavithermus]
MLKTDVIFTIRNETNIFFGYVNQKTKKDRELGGVQTCEQLFVMLLLSIFLPYRLGSVKKSMKGAHKLPF